MNGTDTSMGVEVRRTMVISTAHLHPADAETLNHRPGFEEGDNLTSVPFGYQMWVGRRGTRPAADPLRAPSTDLQAIADVAHEHNCTYVVFDQDGDVCGRLESYEW